MTSVPLSLKLMVPGYWDRWLRDCRALIDHVIRRVPQMSFGGDADWPWLQLANGRRPAGFETDSEKP